MNVREHHNLFPTVEQRKCIFHNFHTQIFLTYHISSHSYNKYIQLSQSHSLIIDIFALWVRRAKTSIFSAAGNLNLIAKYKIQ